VVYHAAEAGNLPLVQCLSCALTLQWYPPPAATLPGWDIVLEERRRSCRDWLQSVALYSPLEICVVLGDNEGAISHLRNGAPFLTQPSLSSLTSAHTAKTVAQAAHWSPSSHFLFGPSVRSNIYMLLLLARYSEHLPQELWWLIIKSVTR
jgi:hypothetical protein